MKLRVDDTGHAEFYCPACKTEHALRVKRPLAPHPADLTGLPIWLWVGDQETPTIHPSIGNGGCHLTIIKGVIQYLPDSRRGLNKSVKMEDLK